MLSYLDYTYAIQTFVQNQINLEKDISTITQSDTYIHIALICKLLARVVDLLSHETHGRKSTKEVWDVCSSIVMLEYKLFKQVEKDWCSSYLVNVKSEEQIGLCFPEC